MIIYINKHHILFVLFTNKQFTNKVFFLQLEGTISYINHLEKEQ